MHAFLLTGADTENRYTHVQTLLDGWAIAPVDTVILAVQNTSIGIADIRGFQARLMLMPYQSPFTTGIIYNADLLTAEAQNALLKTLEEPPPHAKIIIETGNAAVLLPTILSRCQIIQVSAKPADADISPELLSLLTAPAKDTFILIDAVAKTRENAAVFVDTSIRGLRQALLNDYRYTSSSTGISRALIIQTIRRLLTAQRQLSANVNPKLVLDHVFLQIV